MITTKSPKNTNYVKRAKSTHPRNNIKTEEKSRKLIEQVIQTQYSKIENLKSK
jgi:hypothetical protein